MEKGIHTHTHTHTRTHTRTPLAVAEGEVAEGAELVLAGSVNDLNRHALVVNVHRLLVRFLCR